MVWFKYNYKNWPRFIENVLRSTLAYPNETSKECIQFLIERKTPLSVLTGIYRYVNWQHACISLSIYLPLCWLDNTPLSLMCLSVQILSTANVHLTTRLDQFRYYTNSYRVIYRPGHIIHDDDPIILWELTWRLWATNSSKYEFQWM